MATVGITALIPPEIIYATGHTPIDINNFVPQSRLTPRDKLCAWTAVWRELALLGKLKIDKLVVVAGGDCNNAVVDGERIELSGIQTHYFTYPFDGAISTMKREIQGLVEFLGGVKNGEVVKKITGLKNKAMEVDTLRTSGMVSSEDGFKIEVSGSDLAGNLGEYRNRIDKIKPNKVEYSHKVALLGTPPIYSDFHNYLNSIGLHVVYDEMPYEFIRLRGTSIKGLAKMYSEYTFARNISHRVQLLKRELKKRDVDGVIHFHQFACHHKLEDPILRAALGRDGYSFITIEADLPSKTTEQTKLRLEAFKEMLKEVS